MVKASKIILVIMLLVTVCALELKAQSACIQTLRTKFDEGKIHEIQELLKSCQGSLSDEERTEAYRLLILSHIYLDETQNADDAMLTLLKDNPAYEINEQADPVELVNLYNTFRTKPIFYVGARIGGNTTFVNVQGTYGVSDGNGTYTNKVGFEGGLFFEKIFFKRFAAHADLSYGVNSFDYNNEFFQSETGENLVTLLATETQTSAAFTLMAQYHIKDEDKLKQQRKKVRIPYVGIGATFGYIMSSELAGDTKRTDGTSADGANEDLIEEGFRSRINPTVDVEFGYKFKSKLNYFNLSVRYSYGLLNITEKNYDSGRQSTFYGFAANDINTSSVAVALGIILPKYSPKKLIK